MLGRWCCENERDACLGVLLCRDGTVQCCGNVPCTSVQCISAVWRCATPHVNTEITAEWEYCNVALCYVVDDVC